MISFKSEYVILNCDENTVTFHLASICLQMPLTEYTSKNYRRVKLDTLFNQKPDGDKFDTENKWTTFNATD